MTAEQWVLILGSLGAGAALVEVIRAVTQRRKVGADTVSVVSAAARELVEPLRRELAAERAERAAEVIADREDHVARLAQVRSELTSALEEARSLRRELAAARREADQLRSERDTAEREHVKARLKIHELQSALNGRDVGDSTS